MNLFAIFHLNLMFSSIPEENRTMVIDLCYRPLLRVCEEYGFPLGIEASGITLEIIRDLAPDWIEKLRTLLAQGRAEFIGSGYGQVIGPLVPASVVRANQEIGMRTYEEILGTRPAIALVNEQAWSAGLVEHYIAAGFRGVFMDYDNPARFNHWDRQVQHLPQRAKGTSGESIPIIWSRSMVFQKLQRFVHGETELDGYLAYMESLGTGDGWLPVYGNDAEIFDYRPERYRSEAEFGKTSEWELLRTAFEALRERGHIFHLPSAVLNDLDKDGAGQVLSLCTAEQPVPVKKQNKYNLTRWAVSGRNDFFMNSLCRAVAAGLEETDPSPETDAYRKELCFCWSSDFRTHITEKRFAEAEKRLHALAESVGATVREPSFEVCGDRLETGKRLLPVCTGNTSVVLNTVRGLAIHEASFKGHSDKPVFGTLEHGYFDDIGLGADFYSGHMVMEGPGSPKDTDLVRIIPRLMDTPEFIQISCEIPIHQGILDKAVRIHKKTQRIDVLHRFRLDCRPNGYIRLGHITLLTSEMDRDSLFYATENGGKEEIFPLSGKSFDHSNNVSFLVSSSQAAGMTGSRLVIGEKKAAIEISPLISEHAFIAMVTCRPAEPSPFVRVAFSMQEMDETCKNMCRDEQFIFSTGFSIKPIHKATTNV
ncbi:glycoside hydrolase [Maridesulfovibrio sp.]|uniref:glycoside hydrolase n=1 Tax=Maridesulfovibrio sp. TaxID=2795000 RepID=UPI002A18E150|nr:glycoside hydrolase [Maridesulfovibrio sp.]